MLDSKASAVEPTAQQLAEEHAAHVKAREFDFGSCFKVNLARRMILSVFLPLLVVLSTFSIEMSTNMQGFNGDQHWGPSELHETWAYWPLCGLLTAVFLWVLWAPDFSEDVGNE